MIDNKTRRNLFPLIEPFLPNVEKPSRYGGGEWGAEIDTDADYHVVMIYPDTYEVGLPNQGLSILRVAINKLDGIACERGYTPWTDMSGFMREAGVPLLSVESASPIASFDLVGIQIPHELACTNIVETLDLAGIPVWAEERGEDDPIIISGGPSVYNPEPVAPFFDLIFLGEAEHSLPQICSVHHKMRDDGESREKIIATLAKMAGVYAPAFYEPRVIESTQEDCQTIAPRHYYVPKAGADVADVVYKVVVTDFAETDPVTTTIVPYVEIIHDRLSVEILRGCSRGCRFCQAGMTYRPVRERSTDQIIAAAAQGLVCTGYDEVSLTSLSTTDHSEIADMLSRLDKSLSEMGGTVSIPSQRVDAFGAEMASLVAGSRKGGLTLAPEAGTQRLRNVINKGVSSENIDTAIISAFQEGWRRLKLYFMMGLPTETDEDIKGMAALVEHCYTLAMGNVKPSQKSAVKVNLGVAVFVPKASTPFQWCGQISPEESRRRQKLLVDSIHTRAISPKYHDAWESFIEGVLSRGDREVSKIIVEAWRRGARFDAWTEHFNINTWFEAAEAVGIDMREIACTPFEVGGKLPWSHLSAGIDEKFLISEYNKAVGEITTPDCTFTKCQGCGVCQHFDTGNQLVGERGV